MNTLGTALRLHLFGESHGPGVGCVLDGVPAGLAIDMAAIQAEMDQRRPGTGPLVSARKEPDTVQVLSGTHDGRATGAPLALWIVNEDARSQDYADVARVPRPGHADFTAWHAARGHNDPRGGGHASGRLTAPLVAAGALLRSLLGSQGITTGAHVHQVGQRSGPAGAIDVATMLARVPGSPVHTAHADLEAVFVQEIQAVRAASDSVGGVVEFRAEGVPPGWGEPMFHGVESVLAQAFLAVPAAKAASFGAGFAAAAMRGSTHNDPFEADATHVARPRTNHAGGILGGRTTGAPIWGHVAIKPTSSIAQPQESVDLATGQAATVRVKGRHDPCIAVRAVPVVRACLDLALADLMLQARARGLASG